MPESSILPYDEYLNLIEQVDKRQDIIRAQVQQVCLGDICAMFVWGKPGTGKTHTILNELDVMKPNGWKHHKGVDSPKALFRIFEDFPDMIHCWEDCENMYKHAIAADLLRCACGDDGGRDRVIRWKTDREDIKIIFTGAVIIVSNENLSKRNGPLTGVASRCKPIEWKLNSREMMAVMIKIASYGWSKKGRKLTPEQCSEVAEYCCLKMTNDSTKNAVDLRLLNEHGFPAYAFWLTSEKKVHWKEIIDAKLQGEVQAPHGRDEKGEWLRSVALEISLLKGPVAMKYEVWKEKTGLAQAMYHRHLAAAKEGRKDAKPGGKGKSEG